MDSVFTRDVCHFTPFNKEVNSIHTLNFVLETTPQKFTTLKVDSVYKMHYVCSGKGNLHLPSKIIPLSPGDIFITFPNTLFCIESEEDFKYMYISFLGLRARMILDNLSITSQNFLFSDCQEVCDFWKNGIDINPELTDLITESILLYTFSFIGNKMMTSIGKNKQKEDAASIIKKYIDDNFSNQKISLEIISKELSYSPKYVSSIFKRNFQIGITEYINRIRIQNACTLMQQGFTSITNVANQCGFSDSQYFSKVFKQKMGVSPTEYINSLANQ